MRPSRRWDKCQVFKFRDRLRACGRIRPKASKERALQAHRATCGISPMQRRLDRAFIAEGAAITQAKQGNDQCSDRIDIGRKGERPLTLGEFGREYGSFTGFGPLRPNTA